MSLLRYRTLKKICMYQHGISGNVKKQVIDLFDKISLKISAKNSFGLIDKNELHNLNINYYNTIFMPIFKKIRYTCYYYEYDRYKISFIFIDEILKLPICNFMIFNSFTWGRRQYCLDFDDFRYHIEELKEYKTLIDIIVKYYDKRI
jgi:hypothetical protein